MSGHDALYTEIVGKTRGAWKTPEVRCICGLKTRQPKGVCVLCANSVIKQWREDNPWTKNA